MSFQAVTWAIEQRTGSPSSKATLWSIANYANEYWCAWPSQDTICRDSEQSKDSVQRRIPELEALDLVRRISLRFEGRKAVDFFILRPSSFFDRELTEIEPLLPRGHTVYVDSSQSDAAANAAATCGHAQPQTQPQPAANAAATCGHKKTSYEPINQVVEVDARAREPNSISTEAVELAEEIATIAGYPDPKNWPPGWCGSPMRVDAFLREGYEREHMLIAAREVMAGHKGTEPWSIAYFEKAFGRVRGRQNAPLPAIPTHEDSHAAVKVPSNKSATAAALASMRRSLDRRPNSDPDVRIPPRRLRKPRDVRSTGADESATLSNGDCGIRHRSDDRGSD